MRDMDPKKMLLAALALLAVVGGGVLLLTGGDGEEPAKDGTSALERQAEVARSPEENDKPSGDGKNEQGEGTGRQGAQGGGEQPASGPDDPAGRPDEEPASLETNPAAIPDAVVTETGAVQTLPPSPAAQETAMENTYSSIKAFGEEAEGSEATDITFALVQYLNAKAEADWATACARIYSVLRTNIAKTAGDDCPRAFGAMMERASKERLAQDAQIDVASIRRGSDNRAFVIYKTPTTLSADMPMYLEGEVWTVGAIDAYVLTPEQLEENQR